MSASAVDMELKKAFQELQVQVIETRNKVKQIDVQLDGLKRSSQHSKITIQELNGLPDDTKMYESIGRMFVLRDKSTINQLLDQRITGNEEKCQQLMANKSYNDNKVKESENNLRELINTKKLTQ
ncbi:prefoldin subunit 1-like [Oppia nitens]|uniref:prefoldin subunit 1-like n=1 Tax=Oppia nitens TaxID=1686743 RepID=UPI0023DBA63C|nr:prefoldin subunit 1-like [Oppia nitens]